MLYRLCKVAKLECDIKPVRNPGMKKSVYVSFALLFGSSAFAGEDNLVRRLTSPYQGKVYEFVVTQADLDAGPSWPENLRDPPLSARSVMKTAREFVSVTVPDSSRWSISRITLESIGREPGQWLYVVEFNAFPNRDQVLLGPGHLFAVPVLMNGKIVKPIVTATKFPKQP